MQTISFKLLVVFIFSSTISSFGQKATEKNPLSKTKSTNSKTIQLDSSFIGKTTEDKNIKNLFYCWGQIISENENDDSLAICSLTTNIDKCIQGKFKILFEKMLYRTIKGEAVFEITDEILFENYNPNIKVSIVRIKLDSDKVEKNYLAKFFDSRKEKIDKVLSIWSIDYKNKKFIPLKSITKIKFDNPDYLEE